MCPSGQLLYLGCDSSKALRRNERSGLNDVGGGKSNGTLSLSFNILEKKNHSWTTIMPINHKITIKTLL